VTPAPLVLIVDDDVDTCEMYSWFLETHGFRVVIAHSADAAVLLALAETPDAVITDFTLPDGDGFALADQLRQAPHTRNVALILVSGRDFAGDARARASRLFDRVFVKPVLPDDLAGVLVPLLAERSALRIDNTMELRDGRHG
jgi:DNA-binding response OmpR family regulator